MNDEPTTDAPLEVVRQWKHTAIAVCALGVVLTAALIWPLWWAFTSDYMARRSSQSEDFREFAKAVRSVLVLIPLAVAGLTTYFVADRVGILLTLRRGEWQYLHPVRKKYVTAERRPALLWAGNPNGDPLLQEGHTDDVLDDDVTAVWFCGDPCNAGVVALEPDELVRFSIADTEDGRRAAKGLTLADGEDDDRSRSQAPPLLNLPDFDPNRPPEPS